MGEIVVYSANFGGYDQAQPVIPTTGRWVLFTDRPQDAAPGWTVRPLAVEGGDARRTARRIKTLAHRWFPDAEVSVWLDANVQLLADPEDLVAAWLDGYDVASFAHPGRDCLYDEADACIRKGKDTRCVIEAQVNRYRRAGFPANAGLAETRVVVRRHTPQVAQFNEAWQREIDAGSCRDQISFPVAAAEAGLAWYQIPGWVPRHPWFRFREHEGAGKKHG